MIKKILKHPIIVALISGLVITPIGSTIYDHTKNVPILTNFILKPLSVVWDFIITILIFKISFWIILLAILILAVAIIVFDRKCFKIPVTQWENAKNDLIKEFGEVEKIMPVAHIDEEPEEPEFFEYKRDIIKDWIWTWDYKEQPNGYSISNLKPRCPDDDTALIQNGINFGCPRCDKYYGRPYGALITSTNQQLETIKLLILDNIDKKYEIKIN